MPRILEKLPAGNASCELVEIALIFLCRVPDANLLSCVA